MNVHRVKQKPARHVVHRSLLHHPSQSRERKGSGAAVDAPLPRGFHVFGHSGNAEGLRSFGSRLSALRSLREGQVNREVVYWRSSFN